MPRVIGKLWPGKTEQQKQRLTDAVVLDVTSVLIMGAIRVRRLGRDQRAGAVSDEQYDAR
jgi:hypothetical protein